MPTAYTDGVQEGSVTSLQEYAMLCARQFGALITLRDEPLSADVPEFEVADFYERNVLEAKQRLENLESMTTDQIALAFDRWKKSEAERFDRQSRKNEQLKTRYQSMLDKVLAWNPPSSDHVELKRFMVEQLKSSMDWDCIDPVMPKQEDASEWHAQKLERAKSSVLFSEKSLREETERVRSRNEWVRKLRESVKGK